jgi:orotidine-5'-phosphate decarboxylase
VTIAPGIRFDNKNAGDQVRITTPKQAGKTGTDFIVVGRPITKAKDPQAAYNQCLQDFLED